ncbi:hypothetical protein [Niallia sp.]|uniref:hypothetical protein n=1 Tax=Niallia sp. TaxID=2837523 RepID=UPI00289BA85A|nr:hypothetical protein [Niallia sp.]
MNKETKKQIIIVVIEFSKMKRFVMMDMGIGTLSYYVIKMINGNIAIDLIGSTIITEGVKRIYKGMNKSRKKAFKEDFMFIKK